MTTTLAQVATAFLSRQGLAASTVKSYEQTLLSLLKWHGSLPIELIDRQLLKDYLAGLDDLRYTTHNRHQAIISALFNFAVESGYIQSNPASRLSRRKPEKERGEHKSDEIIRYLTSQELDILYDLLKKSNARLETIVRLLHRSGARIGELLSRLVSADFSVSYEAVAADWREVIDQSEKLKGIRLHDLRHTFATERVGLMGIEELRALMGHENIQTTLRYQKVTSARAEIVAKSALENLTKSI
ncbi:tyrosine-type recombinase/integrase [Nostoc favosum]|uniref:Tyrosine-type recombinase/integrase n=1 Tax=Nostoc favosum CHAB5714 TaxID=2780399 RepID=A0ABS8IN49_9NOSO|nr:tyrosine-type recombinase/integrase [Nostoc favosum]MCC5605086.1 tyrosine-type recombinase/integrase [Nostoc favosum CHAB5714]